MARISLFPLRTVGTESRFEVSEMKVKARTIDSIELPKSAPEVIMFMTFVEPKLHATSVPNVEYV